MNSRAFLILLLIGCLNSASPAQSISQSVLDRALEPAQVITNPGPEYSDEKRNFAMTIGIERTPGGRLWAAWVGGADGPQAYFLAATSDDNGATWSAPRLVIDPHDPSIGFPRSALVGNFWTDPTGKLWLFYDQSLGAFDGRAGAWAITCENPDAATPVWSAPRRIWHGMTLNKPIVTRAGEWLMPISLWTRDRIGAEFRDCFHELDDQRMAQIFASTDQGKTWARRGGVAIPETDFDEHMFVELKDGRLWLLARTKYGVAESFSSDAGRTWSEPAASAIQNVSARFFLRRLASGNILLVKNGPIDQRLRKRSQMTAFLSSDEGATWKGSFVLDERDGVSYPDGFQSPDGRIFVSYDHGRSKDREILMATFSEADVLAGQAASDSTRLKQLISKATGPAKPAQPPSDPAVSPAPVQISSARANTSDAAWAKQADEDAKQDVTSLAFDGFSPNKLVCDTTLREMPDGSWVLFMLAGGETEPSPENYTGLTRSSDHGKTWSPLETFNVGFPREGATIGQGPTELMLLGGRTTLFYSTHSGNWSQNWRSWFMNSDDAGKTWGRPEAVPGRLQERTFIRNHIVARDGRILLPFQHYIGPESEAAKPPLERAFTNPRNGVLISSDGGKTWTEHGDIRLTTDDHYFGWAENNIVELSDGRIAMIIRGDKLGGVLYYAESRDGGLTWPEFATKSDIPNPGSKATLYPLGGDTVAMLHNPNPSHRSPLSLWISFDGMKTWPYQRVLAPESCDGPKGRLNYPDGFVSKDRRWLHFAFDDNRHRAVYFGAKLPPLP